MPRIAVSKARRRLRNRSGSPEKLAPAPVGFAPDTALVRELSHAYAESFAVFSTRLVELLRDGSAAPLRRSERSGPEGTIFTPFEEAPDWVKEAYERSKDPNAPSMSEQEARRRVAASKLVLALHDRGMTQADVARKLKKSPAAISRIFRNPERCRVKTLREVAAAIGEDLSDLL